MSDLADIRAALVAELAAVDGAGVVHDHERYAAREAEFRALYVATDAAGEMLRGWYLRRVASREFSEVHGDTRFEHDWLLRGFRVLDDAAGSEVAFDAVIDAVLARLRANPTLNGLVASVYAPDGAGPRLAESVPVLFGGVLCHAARIELTTWFHR